MRGVRDDSYQRSPGATAMSPSGCWTWPREPWRARRGDRPGLPDLLAEAPFAARNEQARTVGDVLLRRTRLGPAGGAGTVRAPDRRAATRVARAMAPELGWDDQRTLREVELFVDEGRAEGLLVADALSSAIRWTSCMSSVRGCSATARPGAELARAAVESRRRRSRRPTRRSRSAPAAKRLGARRRSAAPLRRRTAALSAAVARELAAASARLPQRQRRHSRCASSCGCHTSRSRGARDRTRRRRAAARALAPTPACRSCAARPRTATTAPNASGRCARATPRQDGEPVPAADDEWFIDHLGHCSNCRQAHAAMLEGSVCYRGWHLPAAVRRRRRRELPTTARASDFGRGEARARRRPWLMGIVNATPDSFSDAGAAPDARRARRAGALAAARPART